MGASNSLSDLARCSTLRGAWRALLFVSERIFGAVRVRAHSPHVCLYTVSSRVLLARGAQGEKRVNIDRTSRGNAFRFLEQV